ncbi:MAG: lipopolysaccharide assembly protein LapA domain-containing protein [Phycisphaerales bacterium JB059]
MTMKHVKLAGIAASLIVVVVLILQNTQQVETRILFATIEMPRAVLLFITAALGFAAGVMMTLRRPRKPRE